MRRRVGWFIRWMLASLLLSFTTTAYAVQASDYFHHQVWSTEDGLPQESVHALLQSHEGYLWIGTEDGAARFDGQSFRVFNHSTVSAFVSNDVSCLAEDADGNLWFGTADGLVRKRGEEYRRFAEREGLPSAGIVGVAAHGTDLLVLTTAGLAMWRGDRFTAVPAPEMITQLSSTGGEAALLSATHVYRWSDGQFIAVSPAGGGASVLGAALGSKQGIWTYGSNFVQFSSPTQKVIWRNGSDLPGSRVQALYVDGAGRAWVGTNRGLVSIQLQSEARVEPVEALQGESVLSIAVDREGDLWVGTEASGLHGFQARKFATVAGTNVDGVTTVARDSRGELYFGTREDGLFRVGDGSVVSIAGKKLTSPVILSLAAGEHGDLWAGTPDGMNHIEGATVQHWTIAEGLPDNFVRTLVVGADGSVWAGTRSGLVHVVGNSAQTFTRSNGLLSDSIGPLVEVKSKAGAPGALWVGTSAGLCERVHERFRCLPWPYSNGNIIAAMAADREGSVWVALHGHGLGLVNEQGIIPVAVPGIPGEIVGLLADEQGSLWLRSTHGLARVSLGQLRECVTRSIGCGLVRLEVYGRSDGMPSAETAGEGTPSIAQGPRGELWFATRRGVAVTDPEHLAANRIPPGVVLTSAHVDGQEVPLHQAEKIGPGHRQYSFEYAALSLNNPASTRCRYMLDGFDHGWVEAGSRRTAYYTNLPSRQYSFKVTCANSDGFWSNDEARFDFRVLKPWYRSYWTYVAGILLAGVAVFGFVQLRLRAERRRLGVVLQERTRVAREVHDTLAQDLVSVSLQVELAAQHAKAGRLTEVTEQLIQTRMLVRQALESARQSIWNLRASLSQESLPVRLSARVKRLRETQIEAHLRITGEYRSVPAATENEVMRIANEAISNAERHSGATEIAVELAYGADDLHLRVRDNGCGFDTEAARRKPNHYGLRGLHERAALLHADLTVQSAAGQGTTVTLVAPLATERG